MRTEVIDIKEFLINSLKPIGIEDFDDLIISDGCITLRQIISNKNEPSYQLLCLSIENDPILGLKHVVLSLTISLKTIGRRGVFTKHINDTIEDLKESKEIYDNWYWLYDNRETEHLIELLYSDCDRYFYPEVLEGKIKTIKKQGENIARQSLEHMIWGLEL